MTLSRTPKRYTWQLILGLLLTVILGGAGLSWCGSGDGHDPAWDKVDGVQVPNRRGPYDYESRDGGEP